MKKILYIILLSGSIIAFGQNSPSLLIDNLSTQFSNVSLPYWLKAGQTLNLSTNAKSVSILEFNVNNSVLEYSQAITLTNSQTVPQNKIWKIEAIGLVEQNSYIPTSSSQTNGSFSSGGIQSLPTIFQSPKKFEVSGTYNWKVPPGVTSICIEVWGAGGSGGRGIYNGSGGGGGGGGGYGYQCFTVIPGTNYIITIGYPGIKNSSIFRSDGGSSSVGSLISASGGIGGGDGTNVVTTAGVGAAGGISSNNFNVSGSNGFNGNNYNGGAGGAGGAGGNGGDEASFTGNTGLIPGGGGSGGGSNGGTYYGGNGARGQVFIYW